MPKSVTEKKVYLGNNIYGLSDKLDDLKWKNGYLKGS